MKKLILFVCGWLITLSLSAQGLQDTSGISAIGPSFRVHPGSVTQSEVFIVRSPLDHNILFSACNAINFVPFFVSEGVYSSTNGGTSWSGSDTCNGSPVGYHGGDPGLTIDRNGRFILTHMGRSPFVGLYSHYSTDNGRSWSAQQVVSTDDLERAALATDAIPSSPYYGRTYAVWTNLSQPFPLSFSSTDDGAVSWSAARAVNNPSTRSAGGDAAIGPGGVVYACWAGVTQNTPFKEILVGFASSPNGGSSWNVNENAFAVSGITGLLPQKGNIRVNGLPQIAVDTNNGPRKGWIYIVTGQKGLLPAGSDPDIIMYRSSDGGQTWSAGIRVNQDPLNNGKIQYFPNIYVDQYGAVNIIFYDDRTTTSDSASVFLARSKDGGNTWLEFEISDHHFKPAPIGGLGQGYQGDIIDITSTDSRLIPVWMDNSSGIYQVWTAPVDFSSVNGIGEVQGNPLSDKDLNIFPNPAGGWTTFSFITSSPGQVRISVYDALGNLVSEVLDRDMPAGRHRLTYDCSVLSGGVYLCRLSCGGRTTNARLVRLNLP
jgi:hypothetical protein